MRWDDVRDAQMLLSFPASVRATACVRGKGTQWPGKREMFERGVDDRLRDCWRSSFVGRLPWCERGAVLTLAEMHSSPAPFSRR
jgi:hypothetical protein